MVAVVVAVALGIRKEYQCVEEGFAVRTALSSSEAQNAFLGGGLSSGILTELEADGLV